MQFEQVVQGHGQRAVVKDEKEGREEMPPETLWSHAASQLTGAGWFHSSSGDFMLELVKYFKRHEMRIETT